MGFHKISIPALTLLLFSCNHITEKNESIRIPNKQDQNVQYILNGDQLKSLEENCRNFIYFLSNSASFDSTYNLSSEPYLLYLTSNKGRPIISRMSELEINDFIEFVGVDQKEYILSQFKSVDACSFNNQNIGRPILISQDSMALALDEVGRFNFGKFHNHFKGWLYYISPPIFSKDQKYVLVSHGFTCGSLCGGGYAEIYEKINEEEWKKVKTVIETFY
ncbi:hypothetical protein H7F15_08260 [Pontibacter sp. Tf4]|uniref:hypothetical protein n=1 Tax=Pontibacter sp. Tf4 TaxID=2761620 RepID=UPI001625CE9B|nr:hypothetical protein [Pontibacter sp. Tf4]MBB6611026.1 hypothetical protein [Pontibacter sp. Tf4]